MFDLSIRLSETWIKISNYKSRLCGGRSYYLANAGQSFAKCAKSIYSLYGLLGCISDHEISGLKNPMTQCRCGKNKNCGSLGSRDAAQNIWGPLNDSSSQLFFQ